MSILDKQWVIQNENDDFNLIAKLLENRGITDQEKADWFFKGSLDHLHDPAEFTDMQKAAERIQQAIDEKQSIMIFGDYDVDGITATAILYDFLHRVGAKVSYTLPNREKDGYGLKKHFIEDFKKQEVDLLVTVDCGTSNLEEIKLANELGIEVVVTDHHGIPKELPAAYAIVNPHREDCCYPNKEICGSTIAYKLVQLLANHYWQADTAEQYLDDQLGVVALGVVGDCMALTGENRVLVREGLKKLMAGKNPGITALLRVAGLSEQKIDSTMLGFQVGPRINAAGRIDQPEHAFELLTGQLEKAHVLNELNEKRRNMTKQFTEDAIAQVESWNEIPNIIMVSSPDWPSGLLGLIASKMVELYGRPSIVMQEQEDKWVGSMRSLNEFNITESLREGVTPLCMAFGGHAMAGGFTFASDNAEAFKNVVKQVGENQLNADDLKKILTIDCEIKSHELSFETIQKMDLLEPFGNANPEPVLLLKNVAIEKIKPVGKEGDHLQFKMNCNDIGVDGIAFRFGKHLDRINAAQNYDVACTLGVNEWNGNRKLQLKIIDLKPYESKTNS